MLHERKNTEDHMSEELSKITGFFHSCNNPEGACVKSQKGLERIYRALVTLSACNTTLIYSQNEQELLDKICNIIVKLGGYMLAWVGYKENNENKTVRVVAQKGFSDGYVNNLKISWGENKYGLGPTGIAIRTGKISIAEDIMKQPDYDIWREEALKRGFASSIVLPLICNNNVLGALNIYAKEINRFDEDEIKLLNELTDNIAFGVQTLRERNKIKRISEELKESNENLALAINKLKQTEQKMFQQEKIKVLGQMASGIVHDFKNVLSPILGFSEMLLNFDFNKNKGKPKQYIENIHSAAKDANVIVDRLKALYRPKESKYVDNINVNDTIKTLIKQLNPKIEEYQARGINITIKTDLKDVSDILGDMSELRNALLNLSVNAIDVLNTGGEIEFKTYQENNNVVIEILDNGCGMDSDTKEKCMDLFFTTKGEKGTGMGLYLVSNIIAKHNGEINIKSEVGVGTEWRIVLPVSEKIEKERERERDSNIFKRYLNILVVDDNELSLEIIKEFLILDGHTVTPCLKSEAVLNISNLEEFDLIITDKSMPGLNGFQLSKEIKKHLPTMPILMISGFSDDSNQNEMPCETIDYITGKPITLNKLRQAIEKVMNI